MLTLFPHCDWMKQMIHAECWCGREKSGTCGIVAWMQEKHSLVAVKMKQTVVTYI